jgi:hypothetical protein
MDPTFHDPRHNEFPFPNRHFDSHGIENLINFSAVDTPYVGLVLEDHGGRTDDDPSQNESTDTHPPSAESNPSWLHLQAVHARFYSHRIFERVEPPCDEGAFLFPNSPPPSLPSWNVRYTTMMMNSQRLARHSHCVVQPRTITTTNTTQMTKACKDTRS